MGKLKVVELFAGVGGFRLGLEGWKGKSASSHYTKPFKSGYEVVWSNQWEPSSSRSGERQEANMVYHKNWPTNKTSIHHPYDLGEVANAEMTDAKVKNNIPDHDLLVGGFPCQDYSVAGVNAKGLEGKKGVLWWNIHKILKAKRPKYVFLENVDRLLKSPTDRRGRDFAVMLTTLNNLGYSVEWKVINAADYGMPQRRRRVFILAYHSKSDVKITSIKKWCLTDGVFAKSFPSGVEGFSNKEFTLEKDPLVVTEQFGEGKFFNSGVMLNGKVWTSDYKADVSLNEKKSYSFKYSTLGDVLANDKVEIPESFIINQDKKLKNKIEKIQLSGFELNEKIQREGDVAVLETELDKWMYLKGKKAEQRISSKGTFYYKEGPMKLIEELDQPSRTIITSEGGPGASRFKHLINEGDNYRRLIPMELERLNMFPDNHTLIGYDNGQDVEITDAKRAFFMGNALVVGVVEKVGIELSKFINK